MKTIVTLAMMGAALVLSACGKSEAEKQAEQGAAISKQMAGDVAKVPRVVVVPDAQKTQEGKQ